MTGRMNEVKRVIVWSLLFNFIWIATAWAQMKEQEFPGYSISINRQDDIILKVGGKVFLSGGTPWISGGGCRLRRTAIK